MTTFALITYDKGNDYAETTIYKADTAAFLITNFLSDVNRELGTSFPLTEEGFKSYCEWASEEIQYIIVKC